MDILTLKIEDHCIENIKYYKHKRAKNWIAVCYADRSAPGGINRNFLRRASGSYCVLPTDLKIGEQLEMAGDYYSGSGRKHTDRDYYLITAISESQLDLIKLDNCLRREQAQELLVQNAAPQLDSAKQHETNVILN